LIINILFLKTENDFIKHFFFFAKRKPVLKEKKCKNFSPFFFFRRVIYFLDTDYVFKR